MIQRHVTSAAMALAIVYFIVQLWSVFAPVTAFMKASEWTIDGSTITTRVAGYKLQECDVVKGSFVGWEKDVDGWGEVPFWFPDDLTPDSTRPAEFVRQSFGLWAWHVVNPDNPVRITMQHDCNGDLRTSVIGPFRYK